eukprot:351017-Rhodomonas_salina.2
MPPRRDPASPVLTCYGVACAICYARAMRCRVLTSRGHEGKVCPLCAYAYRIAAQYNSGNCTIVLAKIPVVPPAYGSYSLRRVWYAIVLHASYAISGTGLAYTTICLRVSYAISGTDRAHAAILLRAPYAISGTRTDTAHARILYCWALSGTDFAYCGLCTAHAYEYGASTRCPPPLRRWVGAKSNRLHRLCRTICTSNMFDLAALVLRVRMPYARPSYVIRRGAYALRGMLLRTQRMLLRRHHYLLAACTLEGQGAGTAPYPLQLECKEAPTLCYFLNLQRGFEKENSTANASGTGKQTAHASGTGKQYSTREWYWQTVQHTRVVLANTTAHASGTGAAQQD